MPNAANRIRQSQALTRHINDLCAKQAIIILSHAEVKQELDNQGLFYLVIEEDAYEYQDYLLQTIDYTFISQLANYTIAEESTGYLRLDRKRKRNPKWLGGHQTSKRLPANAKEFITQCHHVRLSQNRDQPCHVISWEVNHQATQITPHLRLYGKQLDSCDGDLPIKMALHSIEELVLGKFDLTDKHISLESQTTLISNPWVNEGQGWQRQTGQWRVLKTEIGQSFSSDQDFAQTLANLRQ